MKKETIIQSNAGKINDGSFVSGTGHPSDSDQKVQEIVEECMFYLGSTEVNNA